MRIGPIETNAFGKLNRNPPIFTRVPWWGNGRTTHLNLTVCIGHSSGFFCPCRRWQNHVSIIGSFGQKNILHNQMIQLGKRRTRMIGIRIGHGRIFTKNIHRSDITIMDRIHDFGHGQAFFWRNRI